MTVLWIRTMLVAALVCTAAGAFAESKVYSPTNGLVNAQTPSACRAGMRVYESDRGRQLLGEIIQADLPRLLPDWDQELFTYEPAAEDVAALRAIDRDIDIICVLGTWCHDSEREVPRFWKIIQEAGNPHLMLTMFAVGRSSDDQALVILDELGFDEPLRQQYGVELVPTFIFMDGQEELGRIIETPETTLEQDAVGILVENAGQPAWN